eukprot:TRINITY_DN1588_c0_g2_i4.p1 TRINITY_DN1588_c0_g2~~TRINITY_DN1588_c0_g2_i4.p1  ORF type:complete len:194 (-),score=17.59 TRINITY_DN1588_c0_g2_i4:613-1194(-)
MSPVVIGRCSPGVLRQPLSILALPGKTTVSTHYARILLTQQRAFSSKSPDTGSDPLPTVHYATHSDHLAFGPRHPVSGLRAVVPSDPTSREQQKRADEHNELAEWHHEFWYHNNVRFEEEKEKFLQQWREDHGDSEQETENALTHFYTHWARTERPRMLAYNKRWHQRNLSQTWRDVQRWLKATLGKKDNMET